MRWRRAEGRFVAGAGRTCAGYCVVAEHDPLLYEGEEYARRLEAAGVPVELRRYEGQVHGFVRLAALTPDAGRALDEISAAIGAARGQR